MNRILSSLLLCAFCCQLHAQYINRQYNNVSVAAALKELNVLQDKYVVNFIYDDLEDFKVTTHVHNRSVPDAVRQIIGFYPIRMTQLDRVLLVECTHKTSRHLTGKIVDEHNEPVAFANIVLLSVADSTIIAGGVSNESGVFVIPYEPEQVLAKISYVGYKTLYQTFSTEQTGLIRLQPEAQTLHAVTVKGAAPLTTLKNEALVTRVEGTFLAKVGTAFDVLSRVPGVIDNGKKIEVIGKGTPLFYINGRLMYNESELDQIASSKIKNVEVITTPGAKYDATVKAIVRITTIKAVGEGVSINNRTMMAVQHYAHGLEELNLNFRRGKLDMFGMVEYEKSRERQFINMNQYTYGSHFLQQTNANKRTSNQRLYAGKVGINYTFNEHHSLGLIYDFSYHPSSSGNSSNTHFNIDETLVNSLSNTETTKLYSHKHLLSSYYSGKMNKWQLDINMDAMRTSQNNRQDVMEVATDTGDRTFFTTNGIANSLFAAKAVVTRDIGNGHITFGTEWSFTNRKDSYDTEETFLSSNHIKIKENNSALFLEALQRLGKLSATVGMRWEHVNNDYLYNGVKSSTESRTYHNLFPSVMLTYPIGNARMRLSYARKITRPAYNQLNSHIQYINRYTYQSGNPSLRPSYKDNLTLNANWKWITFMLDYTHTSNDIISVYTQYKDNQDIALIQKQNAQSYNQFSAMLNLSPGLGKYHPQLMGAIIKQFYDISFKGQQKSLNRPIGIVRFNNAINLPLDIWLNADFSLRTSGESENMYIKGAHRFDLSLYKAFDKDRWSIKLQGTDLFNTSRTAVTIYSDIRKMDMHKFLDTREVSLTIRYTFNATRSKYKGTGAGNEEKQRL